MIQLLQPRAVFAKAISGAGRWAVHYAAFGHPGFCAVTEGSCRLAVEGAAPVVLEAGDFVLLPTTPSFTMSGFEPALAVRIDPHAAPSPGGAVRYGRSDGPADVSQIGGWFVFDAPDAGLLVTLLPRLIHIRGVPRLAQIVHFLGEEAAEARIGRELILSRLVELLLIEALRAAPLAQTGLGVLRGLGDPRISPALHRFHAEVQRPWTIEDLARVAGLSRTAFFDRFLRTVGLRPMEYLLTWRMALAKSLLRQGHLALDEVAERIGYGSASTFSTAFSRHVGMPPGRFMRQGQV